MNKRLRHNNSFVCLDDITLVAEPLNPVIYNPLHVQGDSARRMLHDSVLNGTHRDLTDEQLDDLLQHDVNHLDEFVLKLRKIICYE